MSDFSRIRVGLITRGDKNSRQETGGHKKRATRMDRQEIM